MHDLKLTWNTAQKALRSGDIKVQSKTCRLARHKLNEGEVIEFPESFFTPVDEKKVIDKGLVEMFKTWIIYEDQDIIAINKPCNVASQGGEKIQFSIDELAKAVYEDAKLMHRIDRATSGLLFLGKGREAASMPIVDKTYYAILKGTPHVTEGILRCNLDHIRTREIISQSGRDSITHFQILSSSPEYSFAEFKLETGRKHQIRVHSADILKCPVLGDTKYSEVTAERLYLHSYAATVKNKRISAPMTEDFKAKLLELNL